MTAWALKYVYITFSSLFSVLFCTVDNDSDIVSLSTVLPAF